jgi:uncharacterized protein (TIGR02466 family)
MSWMSRSKTIDNEDYELHYWFPTTLYIVENLLSVEENLKIKEQILKIKDNNPRGGDEWFCNAYNTLGTYDLKDDHIFENLIKITNKHVFEFCRIMGSSHSYVCQEAWANVYDQNQYQEFHTHSDRTISAVYYVDTPVDSGRIIFENPQEPDMLPIKNIENYNPLSYRNAFYSPDPGTLIIFRSNLRHMVELNKSNEQRITVAFNY